VSYSLDAIILLYASDSGSRYHLSARTFLESCMENPDLLCLGWPTVMAYLRIATHPSAFARPLTPAEAEGNVNAIVSLAQTRILSEEKGFWDVYREVTQGMPVRGNAVPDAHLAALLRQHRIRRLYTHDRDFLRFRFLEVLDPLA